MSHCRIVSLRRESAPLPRVPFRGGLPPMAHRVVLLKIKSLMPSLSVKEQAIANFILADPKSASRMTIIEMSSALGVADSTVFKFAKKLGYSGFRDFRNDLLAEEFDPTISVHENVTASDSVIEVAQKVFRSSMKSLEDTLSMLDQDALEHALGILLSAARISFYGTGESGVVALDAYQKFLRSPINCHVIQDSHMQLMQASLLHEGDVAVVVSHTGLTREMIELARMAKAGCAKVIAITSYPSSKIAEYADVTFVSTSEETGYRTESLSSRYAQLAIIDTLYTALMFREPDTAESLHKIRSAINLTKEEN